MPTIINLNDTTPAAPAGKVNVKWQAVEAPSDPLTPRSVSAYVADRCASAGFLIGWNGGDSLGADLAGHRPIGFACTPVKLHVLCEIPPVTNPQSIDILRWRAGVGVSILPLPLEIPAGQSYATTAAFAGGITLADGDYLTITGAQRGGTPGNNIFVELLLQ
jgi:hypothetical protein